MLRVAGAETITEVEGPGKRFALWLQGCSRHCPACCNPHMQSFSGGLEVEEESLAAQIFGSDCEGLTIVGGEPLEQIEGLNCLFDHLVRLEYRKNIMLFSGFTFEEILADARKIKLAERCDVLIAGPFIEAQAPDKRKWIGSRNQTVHFFRHGLDALKADWPEQRAEIEIHIADGQISINGFPVGEDSDFEQIFANFQERQT